MLASALRVFLALGILLPAQGADEKKDRDDAAKKAIDEFKKAIDGVKTPYEKAALIHAFGDSPIRTSSMAMALGRFLAPTGSDIHYLLPATATEALSKFRGERAAAQLLLATMENYRRIPYLYRKMVLAVGRVGSEIALPTFEQWLQGWDGDQAVLAVEALSEMPASLALETLLTHWDQLQKKKDRANDDQKKVIDRVTAEMVKGIKRLSGEKYTTMPEYVIWWKRHGPAFREENKKREEQRRAAPGTPSKLPPILIVELLFNNNGGTATPNTGSSSALFPSAGLSTPKPSWATSAPPNGGPSSLDFGPAPSGPFSVDMGQGIIEHLRNLKSFTIAGWLNVRSEAEGPGGNRVLSWLNHGRDGVELVARTDGSLQLGVNQWAEASPARTPAGQLPVLPDAAPDANQALSGNWRFFAVTYNSTVASGHVKFFIGPRDKDAKEVASIDYPRGPVGPRIGPNLSIGNVNTISRPQGLERMFRGLVDEIRIFGSAFDGSGALTAPEIVKVQDRVQRTQE